jgi:hypothetical protein
MGFDIFGVEPSSKAGRYFRNNIWWWRPLQALIFMTCEDILTVEEARELGYNNGFAYSKEQAEAIAHRLAEIVADEKKFADYESQIKGLLPDIYEDSWSRENVVEFVAFLRDSGGFEVF